MPKKFKKPFICKFQRPLFSSGGVNAIFIYNEERDFEQQMEMADEEVDALFPNGEFKTYWKCIIKDKMLEPLEQVGEQAW